MQFTIPCPLSQGQIRSLRNACISFYPRFAKHLHTSAMVGTLPSPGAFLRGRMVNMRAIWPHGVSIDTFLTAYSSRITASPEHPIFVRSPRSIIWLGVLRWVMN